MTQLAMGIINRLCDIVEQGVVQLIGSEMTESCCLSLVTGLDKFHRRLLAVQRLLHSDHQLSYPLITKVALTVAERTSKSLETGWIKQLKNWKDSWNSKDQPHDAVKQLEAVFVEQIQLAFVALTVFIEFNYKN